MWSVLTADVVLQVSALLLELAAMKQADPTAKAVVFSSWSRLLRLVEEALQDNGIAYTSIAGAQAETRGAALRKFVKDPDCTVLTVVMSTGGGAAGLTLTVASHVFLLEPNLNPGLEAQAAARVYRLGRLLELEHMMFAVHSIDLDDIHVCAAVMCLSHLHYMNI